MHFFSLYIFCSEIMEIISTHVPWVLSNPILIHNVCSFNTQRVRKKKSICRPSEGKTTFNLFIRSTKGPYIGICRLPCVCVLYASISLVTTSDRNYLRNTFHQERQEEKWKRNCLLLTGCHFQFIFTFVLYEINDFHFRIWNQTSVPQACTEILNIPHDRTKRLPIPNVSPNMWANKIETTE